MVRRQFCRSEEQTLHGMTKCLPKMFFNREIYEPRERMGFFAWFGYFAVFEAPYSTRFSLPTAFVGARAPKEDRHSLGLAALAPPEYIINKSGLG